MMGDVLCAEKDIWGSVFFGLVYTLVLAVGYGVFGVLRCGFV